jgi:glycosyltransferase involved in cell wall biosynthesis
LKRFSPSGKYRVNVPDIPIRYISYLDAAKQMPGAIFKAARLNHANTEIQQSSTLKSKKSLRLLRALAIAKECARDGIDHIHAHWPYAAQIAHLVNQLNDTPYSVSIHAHEVEHDHGHFPVVFRSLKFATFCNSAGRNRVLSRLDPQAEQKSHLVYHGVNLESFQPAPPVTPNSPLRVISAGRLTRTKGFDNLIKGCAALKHKGIKVDLTILGSGQLEVELWELARNLEFESNLRMPGWIDHGEVADRIRNSHVFALMANTNYNDGLPNVALEAMACGRPVILSPLPAAREAVTQNVDGFVLESPDDIDGLVDILESLAADPRILTQMGEAARDTIESQFNANAHSQRLLDLFFDQPLEVASS